jgi:Ca2+-binding EF-hand superfamily protein
MSFEQLDADGNGLINKKEFLAQAPNGRRSPEDMFELFDDDGTGTITPEEFKDAVEKMQSERNTRSKGGGNMGRRGGMKGGGW